MGGPMADRFMRTLQEVETSHEAGALVRLFAEDAELNNLAHSEPYRGRDGALKFWSQYLSAFGEIRSRFEHVVESNGNVVLEWVSDGTLSDGAPVSYRGVSILETKGDVVHRFRTYYDSAAFVKNAPAARRKD